MSDQKTRTPFILLCRDSSLLSVECLYGGIGSLGAAVFNIEDVVATAQPLFSDSAQRRKLRWGNREKILYFEEVAACFVHAGLFFTENSEEPMQNTFNIAIDTNKALS